MAIILNIDTAVGHASICLSKNGKPLQLAENKNQQDHAAWIHSAIGDLIRENGYKLKDIDAIGVSIGPGSYTGLRIGLSTAKGLCYALKIPLLAVNTLLLIAKASMEVKADYYCPMIDARRMEVFTSMYDHNGKEVMEPLAMILDENSFSSALAKGKVLFSGNGSPKLEKLIQHPNALYSSTQATAADMVAISEDLYMGKQWADLAYAEPFYLKEFYNAAN